MLKKPWATAFGFAAWVGLDWAKEKHAVSMKDIDSGQRERCEVGSTPEAIELWAAALYQRYGGRPVAVALQESRGSVICMLTTYAHRVLFPSHRKMLAQYRKAIHPSVSNADPTHA